MMKLMFHDPWLLLLIPFALYLFYLQRKRDEEPGIKFSSGILLSGYRASVRVRVLENIGFMRGIAAILIILAVARPQMVSQESTVLREGIDIVIAVDVSSSMLAEDMVKKGGRVSRIEAAKELTGEFIAGRSGDRIGITIFAQRGYPLSPLTFDHNWLILNVERIEAGILEDGTAIGSGLLSTISRLKGSVAKRKVVILLTDGRNNAGDVDPETAAEAARALGVKVYTIGIGSKGPVMFPTEGPLGNTVYRSAEVDIDDDALSTIASRTGGKYFRATDPESLSMVFKEIDTLEKSRIEEKRYFEYEEVFHLFLIPGIVLLFLEVLMKSTILRTAP